jgi:hypothetical protein
MAYVIALMNKAERDWVEELGFELEEAPKELVPREFKRDPINRMKMVWVDCSMWDLLKPELSERSTELVNLLNRAAAALETPQDLSPEDVKHLIEDLVVASRGGGLET